MPPPDRMLATLRRATELVAATPGRVGHLVHLQNCTDVLVAGDLHGHIPNFQVVFKAADLGNHPGRHLVLQEVVHGKFRYPNGSDKSHQLLDLFAALKCQFPDRVHLLPGNHELAQWKGREIGKDGESLNDLFRKGVDTAYGSAGTQIYVAYLALFAKLPLALRTPNAVFVSHTLIPGRQLPLFDPRQLTADRYEEKEYQPGGLVYGLTWGRDTSEQTAADFARKVDSDLLVTGHIPTDDGYLVPNDRQVIVDCSASPASYVLFPADRPLTHAELVQGVVVF
ncbi:MAG: metallophosphoesterase [Gemmataceae bacterium]